MAEASHSGESSHTVTLTSDNTDASTSQTVRLKLTKPPSKKRVIWSEGTVDNEHLGRKKSKCCCIYKKPRANLDDSSSDDDDLDCENCRGHVEKRKSQENGESGEPSNCGDPQPEPATPAST